MSKTWPLEWEESVDKKLWKPHIANFKSVETRENFIHLVLGSKVDFVRNINPLEPKNIDNEAWKVTWEECLNPDIEGSTWTVCSKLCDSEDEQRTFVLTELGRRAREGYVRSIVLKNSFVYFPFKRKREETVYWTLKWQERPETVNSFSWMNKIFTDQASYDAYHKVLMEKFEKGWVKQIDTEMKLLAV